MAISMVTGCLKALRRTKRYDLFAGRPSRSNAMPRLCILAGAVFLAATGTADPQARAWRPLFDGTDLAGWNSAAGQQPGKGWIVDGGALVRKEPAGDLWTRDRFGDFILDLEFQTTGNSGVFIRTDKLTDNVQTGLEIQI